MNFFDEAVIDTIELAKNWKIKGCTFWCAYILTFLLYLILINCLSYILNQFKNEQIAIKLHGEPLISGGNDIEMRINKMLT